MIIQIVIRLIINTDQYITRIGTIIEGSDSESSSNNTEVDDTSSTNSSYNGDEGQNIIKGIDNTVRLPFFHDRNVNQGIYCCGERLGDI